MGDGLFLAQLPLVGNARRHPHVDLDVEIKIPLTGPTTDAVALVEQTMLPARSIAYKSPSAGHPTSKLIFSI
jgi:hypothetical protein